MAQAAKGKKPNTKATPGPVTKEGPNWPLFALAAIGMVLSGYLTYAAWQEKLVAFCTTGSGCDVVLNSRWSTLLGMPTSLWGFLTYALLAAVAWNKRTESQWKFSWFVSLSGSLFSIYLTAISIFELHATCPYCLTSLGLMTVIFILVSWQRPSNMRQFSWGPWLGKSVTAAVVGIVIVHLQFAGYLGNATGPEDPWIKGLAEHLTKIDAKFYGASWCPHCKEQKEMFGASVKRLPYVECSPGGPEGPVAQVCKQADVQSYPTWVIQGQRFTGTQPLESLAQSSKFKYEGGSR